MMDNNRDLERHLTTEQLLDYIERRLSPDDTRQVEAHLAGDCSSCQDELAWLTNTLSLMAPDAWIDAPAYLQTSVRQKYREQFARDEIVATGQRQSFSISQWLQSLFAPRRPLLYAAVGIVLVVVVVGLLLQPWSSPAENGGAEIAAYTGTVEIQSPGDDTWQPAESSEAVNAGDEVRTGDESSVVLSFPDQSKTLMTPYTELRVLKMSLDEELGDRIIILQQQLGRTQNYVQPLTSAGSRFEIRTPAATVSVRGTAFTVEVDADGTTRVAVSEGRVEVSAQGVTIALDAGEGTVVEIGSPPGVVEAVPTVPIPTQLATLIASPAPRNTEQPPEQPPEQPTKRSTATSTVTPKPSETPTTKPSVAPSPSAVVATWTPSPTSTPTATTSAGPGPTEPPPTPRPTNTPGPAPSSTPVPPATATSEPPPPTPTDDPWVPPGQTKTPNPPGQTRTPPGQNK